MKTKLHFRRKTIEVLVPVLGSGYEIDMQFYTGMNRTTEEYKKYQLMAKKLEKDGKLN